MDASQKIANTFNGFAIVAGTLSLTEKITFIAGLVCIVTAVISNYYSYAKNRSQKKYYDALNAKNKLKNEK